ncbi:MAG: HDIG domain-containing metalloprotein [Terriglobales bacterium]
MFNSSIGVRGVGCPKGQGGGSHSGQSLRRSISAIQHERDARSYILGRARRCLRCHGKLIGLELGVDSMQDAVAKLWPEIEWIEDKKLRGQVAQTWIKALERSPLKPEDLNRIPFTLLVPNCPITFMEHKRCVVHIARRSAEAMHEFMGRALPIDMDTVIAGAILADVGKLLEYELGPDGKSRQSERGEALRHPFTGVALALECGVPDAVCHIIAAHAAEGDLVKRSTEAYIVHHADFMAYLPFKNPKNIVTASKPAK